MNGENRCGCAPHTPRCRGYDRFPGEPEGDVRVKGRAGSRRDFPCHVDDIGQVPRRSGKSFPVNVGVFMLKVTAGFVLYSCLDQRGRASARMWSSRASKPPVLTTSTRCGASSSSRSSSRPPMSKSEASLSKSTNKSMSLSKVSSRRATDPKTRMRVARCRARSAMTSSRRSASV